VDISQVTFQIRVVSRIATAADALGAAASSALAVYLAWLVWAIVHLQVLVTSNLGNGAPN
jgi:hypothetical protein